MILDDYYNDFQIFVDLVKISRSWIDFRFKFSFKNPHIYLALAVLTSIFFMELYKDTNSVLEKW